MTNRYECTLMLPHERIVRERATALVIRKERLFIEDAEFIKGVDFEYIESDMLKIGVNADLHQTLFGEDRAISFFKLEDGLEIAGFTHEGIKGPRALSIIIFLSPKAFDKKEG